MSFDALLWLSFGGPEGPEDVRPFLENVVRGRGVPPERLDEVEAHYQHFGGVSPINRLNTEAIEAVRARGFELPIYFGNRNWHPMVEDIVRALAAVPDGPELVKLRQFFDHPLFVSAFADGVRAAAGSLSGSYRLVFTAHSVPVSADKAAGPPEEGGYRYSRQVVEASRLVAAELGVTEYDVVWQSRSGPPQIPWLEPDIVDHIDALHAKGVTGVVVCPIGFVSDHLEVVWDLDTEARDRCAELGMEFARAATPNSDPRFAELVVELVAEHTEGVPARKLSSFVAAGCTVNGAPCAPLCCEPVKRPVRA